MVVDHCSQFRMDTLASLIERAGFATIAKAEGWTAKEIGIVAVSGVVRDGRALRPGLVENNKRRVESSLSWLEGVVKQAKDLSRDCTLNMFGRRWPEHGSRRCWGARSGLLSMRILLVTGRNIWGVPYYPLQRCRRRLRLHGVSCRDGKAYRLPITGSILASGLSFPRTIFLMFDGTMSFAMWNLRKRQEKITPLSASMPKTGFPCCTGSIGLRRHFQRRESLFRSLEFYASCTGGIRGLNSAPVPVTTPYIRHPLNPQRIRWWRVIP
jgi:hypothetical protein